MLVAIFSHLVYFYNSTLLISLTSNQINPLIFERYGNAYNSHCIKKLKNNHAK